MRIMLSLAIAAIAEVALVPTSLADIARPVLNSARIERHGPTFELHFGFDAIVPRLQLSAHGNQLWIDLARTHMAILPRPLFGSELAPIKSVRPIDAATATGKSRIVVEVIGRADYAVARLPHEIILRIAPPGAP